MNLKNYFKTNEIELRLIDYVSMAYAFFVIVYTIDDIKRKYPIYLISFGLIMHIIAYLVWRDEKREKSYFGKWKMAIYRMLPVGLCLLYTLSILAGIKSGEADRSYMYNVIVYMVAIVVPMILFYISMGFGEQYFGFLRQRKYGVNVIYLGLVVLMIIGQKFVGR